MATIIGRIEEQSELNEIFKSNTSEFVAIYGRRRVGKTYLVRNYYRSKKCIYFQVVGLQNGTLEEQLQNFADSLSETFFNNIPLQVPASWKDAFKQLTTIIEKQHKRDKIIIFLDELPWMATPRSGLLTALDYFWNKYWVDFKNLKLFICGSSASWIIKKIIYNKGGLHNRVTRQIILRPFSLKETKLYLENLGCKLDHKQILEIYMAIGGIPYYLNAIKKTLTPTQNINNLCFRKSGLLFDEFNKLFSSLFDDARVYIELIRLISSKHYGISRPDLEKLSKLSTKGGTLTERLKELEEAGFIATFLSLGHKTRGLYYKTIDEYALFYLTWIESEKNSLLKIEAQANFWKAKHKTPPWNTWAGYSFEMVCYKHIASIRKALDIPESSRASVWRTTTPAGNAQRGAQIDLLFDRDDGAITLCEIKFSSQPFTLDKEYASSLIRKKEVFIEHTKTEKQVFIALLVSSTVKNNFYAEDLLSGVVILDQLFE